MILTQGELFAGIGGFGVSGSRFGIRPVWASEIEPYAIRVYRKHFPEVRMVGDLTTWEPDPATDRVDLITGGFPCQPASTAGRRQGTDDVRWLWPAYARIIRLLRPRYVLAENVSGLRSVNDGKAFEEVLTDLDALGYDAEWESIPASAVGAPHQRDRIWIVAYPRGFGRREDAGGPPPHEGADEGRPPEDHHVADGDGQGGGAGLVAGSEGQFDMFGGPKNHDPGEFFVFDGAAEALALFRKTRGREQWGAEPDVPRVAARVPDRVHRLRCLGNAIVPLVAEFVMSRIIEFDRKVVEAGCDRSFA